jgi:hypothetical protein
MKIKSKSVVLAAFIALLSAQLLLAQTPNAPLGLVGKAASAKIGNSAATEGATIYSGDYLSTDDGGVLQVRVGTLALELQSNSSAHIYRAPYGAVVELNSGTIFYTTPGNSQNVVIVASDVRVTPVLNTADFGRVSVDDPCNVSVQSDRGQADVRVGRESHLVEAGKAYRVRAENSISYRKYLSPEEDEYHKYHEHTPCAALNQVKGRPPVAPGQSRFLYLAAGVTAAATVIPILESFESPNRP